MLVEKGFASGPFSALKERGLILGEAVPFTSADAVRAAERFNLTGRRRGSFTDCLIAAAALNAGATIATSHPADFRRFPGLNVLAF